MSATRAPTLRWAPVWVVALVALWPLPDAAQGVLALGALGALLWLLLRRRSGGAALLSGPAWALTSVLFCAYWLPEAAATLDAEDGWPAWRTAAFDLRLLPFLWLAAAAVADATGRRRAFGGLALVAMAWTLDGLWAALSGGRGLLFGLYATGAQALGGFVMCPRGATVGSGLGGAFGGCGAWFGLALACLAPFALDAAERAVGRAAWLAALWGLTMAIALSATPAAWIAFACVLALELLRQPTWRRRAAGVGVVVAGAVIAWALATHGPGRSGTVVAVPGNDASVRAVAVDSVALWGDALCVVRAHPFNGVGAGGLDEALRACRTPPSASAPDSGMVALPLGLEILGATGAIGLLLWLAGVALAWRAWRYADAAARTRAWPALQALVAMLFPLNASLPVYGGLWATALLLMAGLYAGALWGRIDAPQASQGP